MFYWLWNSNSRSVFMTLSSKNNFLFLQHLFQNQAILLNSAKNIYTESSVRASFAIFHRFGSKFL